MFCVTDKFGRSYFEGRTFETRIDAEDAALDIHETDRPFGVWIATDDNVGEEIIPAVER
jgi:hypothetical protein